MAKAAPTVYRRVVTEGGASVAHQGLSEMPLTLWVIVAAVVLYLYLRRANLGIDTHPGEAVTVAPRPAFRVPILPPVPGTPNGPAGYLPNPPLVGQPGGASIITIPQGANILQ